MNVLDHIWFVSACHCWTSASVHPVASLLTVQHVCRLVMGIYSEDNELLESKFSPPIRVKSNNDESKFKQHIIRFKEVLGAQLLLKGPPSTGDEASSSPNSNAGNHQVTDSAAGDAEDQQHACRLTMGTHTKDDMLLESARSFPMRANSGNVSFRSLLGAELPLQSPQSTGDEASSSLKPNIGNHLFSDLAADDKDGQYTWQHSHNSHLPRSVDSSLPEPESHSTGRILLFRDIQFVKGIKMHKSTNHNNIFWFPQDRCCYTCYAASWVARVLLYTTRLWASMFHMVP